MENISKTNISKIKLLLEEIDSNQYIQIRSSNHYEPFDIEESTKNEISEACFYKLMECVDLLKNLVDDNS